MNSIDKLVQSIRERGGKVTPQRLMIYQALERDQTHPTAEAIHAQVCESMPMVSLTTVYKTLNELVALGELRRFDVDGTSHFDTTTTPHAEVVCLSCGAIADVVWSTPPQLPIVPDFQIVSQTQTFLGYCGSCRLPPPDGLLPAN